MVVALVVLSGIVMLCITAVIGYQCGYGSGHTDGEKFVREELAELQLANSEIPEAPTAHIPSEHENYVRACDDWNACVVKIPPVHFVPVSYPETVQ